MTHNTKEDENYPARYVVYARNPTDNLSIPESYEVNVITYMDRGLLIEAEDTIIADLAAQGWRVKKLIDPHTIKIFSYTIDTNSGMTPDLPNELIYSPGNDTIEAQDDINHLVQFVGPIQESWLSALQSRGVRVIEAVGPYSYFIRVDPETVKALMGLSFVAWTGRLEPGYKINPSLLGLELEDGGPVGGDDHLQQGLGEIVAYDIGVLADGDLDAILTIIEEQGGQIQALPPASNDQYRSITTQLLPPESLVVLSKHRDVRWIDSVRRPVLEDERTAQIAYEDLDGVAAPNTAPVTGYAANLANLGVDGTGVTIAICDTGIDTNSATTIHADLAGRLSFAVNGDGSAITGGDTNGHGTHVAGIAAGDGDSGDTDPQGFRLGIGVAPDAQVGSLRFNGTAQQRIQTAAQQGADIMNNSYALNGPNYSANDRQFDLGVRDADPTTTDVNQLVIVFSAGNSGPGNTSCTKAVKNAFVVGNSLNARPGEGDIDDIRGLRASSSRGPAGDGRLQPHLVAPGTNVVSARSSVSNDLQYVDTAGTSHANHTQKSGTSMAAPIISGMSAVLIDWWRQSRGGATPSPALLRALMTVSTESMQGGPDRNGGTIAPEPTNDAGWGRVSLENTLLQAPASDRGPKIFQDQRHAFTATGQEYRIRVAAANPTQPLRVTLAWTDAAGAVGSNPALVNDLDLEVVEEMTGNVFRGNVFTNGFSTSGGTADSLNNLECVFIQNPNGVYEISVIAANIPASARPDITTPWQDFALVIDNGEVPAADPVNVVTVLDRSASMQTFGYVDTTRQTSRQFIDMMSVDDSIGVVSFGTTANQEYPTAGSLQLITDQTIRDAAISAIDGITFGGCTFMGKGIESAGTMLSSSVSRRAMILLSDGYDNKGCDQSNSAKPSALDAASALPTDLPIYTCAMGPASDEDLLSQLAEDSGGRYYFMPTIDDLFEIYNYIRGQVTGEGIIINESSMASHSTVSGFVDSCSETAIFTVAWHDDTLKYVAEEPRSSNDISVQLKSPSGRWLPFSATEIKRTIGTGYVSLKLQDPQPGLWTVQVVTASEQHTRYTVGGFVKSDINLSIEALKRVSVGQPIDIRAFVRDINGPLNGFKCLAKVSSPLNRTSDLLKQYARNLKNVNLPRNIYTDISNNDHLALTKLVILRNEIRANTGKDILSPVISKVLLNSTTNLPTSTLLSNISNKLQNLSKYIEEAGFVRGLGKMDWDYTNLVQSNTLTKGLTSRGKVVDLQNVFRTSQKGILRGRFDRTKIAGNCSFAVRASGYSPSCKSRFVRLDLISSAVLDRSIL